jgi:serine/threonine protein kinase
MYDASEIGIDWKGSLETLSSIPQAKCAIAIDNTLKEYTGKERCAFIIEETIADNTLGKLAWAKRSTKDVLIKRPISQKHGKQEAIIQWLVNKSLSLYSLDSHCPKVYDIFTYSNSIWFSMEPVYSAPILNTYLQSIPTWQTPVANNGYIVFKILSQIAMACFVLEKTIGFNHRDLKPDNLLIKIDSFKSHSLRWKNEFDICIAPSHTAIMVDFGFSCLGPGTYPWIQSGDGVLSIFDSCPKVGRDIFMILVFLIWREDVRKSLTRDHLEFIKSSLHLSTERLTEMIHMNRNPSDWIYMLITERGFKCPALDPLTWLKNCSKTFPDVLTFKSLQ